MADIYDIAVIGGGIMGCATALNLARGGMKVAVLERKGLCMEASGVNAGTLTHRTGPVSMQGYYTRSIQMWKTAHEWLDADVGFGERGGLTVAFNDQEAERAERDYNLRKQQEVEIEMIDGDQARRLDPNLSKHVVRASYFPRDAFANSNRTGYGFSKALKAAGATIMTETEVQHIEHGDGGFTMRTPRGVVRSKQIVICSGAWVRKLVTQLGFQFRETLGVRLNMMSVTERLPKLFNTVITHANTGLTLKQPANGTVLIGGGWQGQGNPITGETSMIRKNVETNFRLLHSVFPDIENTRAVRTWFGFEARLAGNDPLAGPLADVPGAFVAGIFHSGWTVGPYIGKLIGDLILGRALEMPLFDPSLVLRRATAESPAPTAAQ